MVVDILSHIISHHSEKKLGGKRKGSGKGGWKGRLEREKMQ